MNGNGPAPALDLDGLCECGCGQRTSIPTKTNRLIGRVKGRPMRFVTGHNNRGVPTSAKQKEAARRARTGERNNFWRGDEVGNASAHDWLRTHFVKEACDRCESTRNLDFAYKGPNGHWSRNRDDYLVLCRSCHIRFDRAKA